MPDPDFYNADVRRYYEMHAQPTGEGTWALNNQASTLLTTKSGEKALCTDVYG